MKRTAIPPIESPRLKIPDQIRIGGVNYTVVQSSKIIGDNGRPVDFEVDIEMKTISLSIFLPRLDKPEVFLKACARAALFESGCANRLGADLECRICEAMGEFFAGAFKMRVAR